MSPLFRRLLDRWVARQRERQRIAASRRAFLRTVVIGSVAAPFIDVGAIVERITRPTYRSGADLLRAMGSRDRAEALAAQEAFAAFMTAPILQVIEQAPVISDLFSDAPFESSGSPTIQLDLGAWEDDDERVFSGGICAPRQPHFVLDTGRKLSTLAP